MLPEAPVDERDGSSRQPRRTRRRAIDWCAVERDYRSGLLSLRELAHKHDCSHSAIANFAGRHGWIRNLPLRPVDAGKGSHHSAERRSVAWTTD